MHDLVYGDVAIDHMGPRYGPMAGNERVYAVVKGRVNKEDLTVFVHEVLTGWREQIAFTKTGNVLFFAMPRYPSLQRARAVVTITICYQGAELYESNFVYKDALDGEKRAMSRRRRYRIFRCFCRGISVAQLGRIGDGRWPLVVALVRCVGLDICYRCTSRGSSGH